MDKKYSSPQKELPLEMSLLKRLSSEGETEMANRSKESYREENAQLKSALRNWKNPCPSPAWKLKPVI